MRTNQHRIRGGKAEGKRLKRREKVEKGEVVEKVGPEGQPEYTVANPRCDENASWMSAWYEEERRRGKKKRKEVGRSERLELCARGFRASE